MAELTEYLLQILAHILDFQFLFGGWQMGLIKIEIICRLAKTKSGFLNKMLAEKQILKDMLKNNIR